MKPMNPLIVAYCCHYCAYTAADMAGSLRLSYPADIKIIRVPCTGKVDPLHVLRALQNGADGVLVAGCLEGDCHFKNGNVKAAKRIHYLKQLLGEIGIEETRVAMIRLSAGMGKQFAERVSAFADEIRKLGPRPSIPIQEPDRIVSEIGIN